MRRSLSRALPRERLRVASPPVAAECRVRIDGHVFRLAFAPLGFDGPKPEGVVQIVGDDGQGEFRVSAV